MEGWLAKMLENNKKLEFKLIHDSKNDKTAASFDKAVKGIGPTLIIIKATTNFVFGAFVQDTFGSGESWIKGSDQTFLFTFGAITDMRPIKLLHNGT